MREGKLPEGTGVLLAGEGGTNAGLTPPPWFRFRYGEAAAQRYIPWPGHIPRWDGLNPHLSLTPSPALSLFIVSQGPISGKGKAC